MICETALALALLVPRLREPARRPVMVTRLYAAALAEHGWRDEQRNLAQHFLYANPERNYPDGGTFESWPITDQPNQTTGSLPLWAAHSGSLRLVASPASPARSCPLRAGSTARAPRSSARPRSPLSRS